jgi:hypothetical protein
MTYEPLGPNIGGSNPSGPCKSAPMLNTSELEHCRYEWQTKLGVA